HHLGFGEGDLHHQDVRRVVKPVDVFLEAEHGAASVGTFVTANPLEDAETIMQGVRQDMDLRLIPGDHLSVQPDLVDFLNHFLASTCAGFASNSDRKGPLRSPAPSQWPLSV